jgi:hypothetical protein
VRGSSVRRAISGVEVARVGTAFGAGVAGVGAGVVVVGTCRWGLGFGLAGVELPKGSWYCWSPAPPPPDCACANAGAAPSARTARSAARRMGAMIEACRTAPPATS